MASFYIIDQLPSALVQNNTNTTNNNTTTQQPLERVDIDLGPDRLAFTIDNVLSDQEADALAACAEAVLEHNGHSRLAPGIRTPPGMRINEAAHWYPSRAEAPLFLGSMIMDRIRHLVPQTLVDANQHNGDVLLPLYDRLSEKVAQFKYNPHGKDQFKQHIDGLFPGQGANAQGDGIDEWTGVVSGFSMLFYLNDHDKDGLVGGETRLWSADASYSVDITPRKGRVLLFRRGSPNAVLHAGLPVSSESAVPKYMALINLAYGEQSGLMRIDLQTRDTQ
jgi:hypothetical protein